MADEITIHIDGQEVRTTSDKMVIQAANDAGIYIPYLCYHPGMKPYGACRMCVVEVEGARGTPASCTLPVRDGMQVSTQANPVQGVRDTIMDLLLSEHPHGCLTCHRIDLCGPQDICLRHVDVTDRCVICPKNERCELKDTTRFHTQGMNSPLTYQYRELQVETTDPFYDRDYNLCIVCARCVRACDELRGDVALTLTERAGQVLVGTSMGESLLEAGCEFCGACIDVCPVGALAESDYKWERPSRVEQSVCSGCSVGCQVTYEVNGWERVVRAVPELNAPANHGQACFKGKFGFKQVNDKQRLKEPMVRRDGLLEAASWDDATTAAAQGFTRHKGGAFGMLVSPHATNEEMYLAQKFARAVMDSNNIDSPSNTRPGILDGLAQVLGHAAATGSVWDLKDAACVLAVSANVTEEQNVLAVPIKQAVRAGTQQLIVIDAREVELTRYAHLWLRPYPGTDLALLGGMLRVVLDEGLADQSFLATNASGLDGLRTSLSPFSLDAVSAETGVPADQIAEAARLFASTGPASIIYGLDNVPAETLVMSSRAIADLALVTGNLGRTGAGVYPLRTGANDQGAWDMGLEPRLLPGQRPVADAETRISFGVAWGVTLPEEPGMGAAAMLDAARRGELRALFIVGDHAAYHDGSLGDVSEALDKLEFLVVSDVFPSPLTEQAQVVLPAATWLEKHGTYTNIERRVQLLRRVFQLNTTDAMADYHTIAHVAAAMGSAGFEEHSPAAVLGEVAGLVDAYAGVSLKRLEDEAVETLRPSPDNPMPTQVQYSERVSMGLQWPCPSAEHSGTPLLYADGFSGGKILLGELSWLPVPRHDDTAFPFLLAHGRVLAQPTHPVEVVKSGGLNRLQREELLVIHPQDAERHGLQNGQSARVVAQDGRRVVQGSVRVWDGAHQRVLALTTLFGELATELDGSEHPDPMNHVPRLDIMPVRIEPA
jgi:formate dehydrogenase alpha subunit